MRYVIREKFFRIGEDSTITDESGQPVFDVDGKVLSIHHTLVVRDVEGREVARVRKELLAFRPTYNITMQGREVAEVRKKLISPLIDRFTVEVAGSPDFTIKGSIFDHDYIMRRGDQVIASISKAWVSLTETYGVDIAPGENDVLILASVLALDLAEDEERVALSF